MALALPALGMQVGADETETAVLNTTNSANLDLLSDNVMREYAKEVFENMLCSIARLRDEVDKA